MTKLKFEKPKLVNLSCYPKAHGDCASGTIVNNVCKEGSTVAPGCMSGGIPTSQCACGGTPSDGYPCITGI